MGSNFITTLWNWSVSLYKILKGLHGLFKPKKGFGKQFRKLPSWKRFPHVSLNITNSPLDPDLSWTVIRNERTAYFPFKRRHNFFKKSPRILYPVFGDDMQTISWLSLAFSPDLYSQFAMSILFHLGQKELRVCNWSGVWILSRACNPTNAEKWYKFAS